MQMMYDQISEARASRPGGVRKLAADCVATLEYVRTHAMSVHHLTDVAGTNGATDVVQVLDQVLTGGDVLVT